MSLYIKTMTMTTGRGGWPVMAARSQAVDEVGLASWREYQMKRIGEAEQLNEQWH